MSEMPGSRHCDGIRTFFGVVLRVGTTLTLIRAAGIPNHGILDMRLDGDQSAVVPQAVDDARVRDLADTSPVETTRHLETMNADRVALLAFDGIDGLLCDLAEGEPSHIAAVGTFRYYPDGELAALANGQTIETIATKKHADVYGANTVSDATCVTALGLAPLVFRSDGNRAAAISP